MEVVALIIFVATMALVVAKPFKIPIGASAIIGAAGAFAVGLIHISDVATVWRLIWNATLTLIALVVISLVLADAGFFKYLASRVANLCGSSTLRLFVTLQLLTALTAAIFANDGAALILTPVVLDLLEVTDISLTAQGAFVFAVGFVADATSLPFVISNLTNIITSDYFHLSFNAYAAKMVIVDLATLAATLIVTTVIFRGRLPRRYGLIDHSHPSTHINDRTLFRAGNIVLVLTFLAYFGLANTKVPVSIVTSIAAIILLSLASRHKEGKKFNFEYPKKVVREAPWQIIIFSLAMYLVVFALVHAGYASSLGRLFSNFATSGKLGLALGVGGTVAIISSIANNLPTVLIGSISISSAHLSHHFTTVAALANVVGTDLGPKITPIGSLATLIWLEILAKRSIHITWWEYFKYGIAMTAPVIVVALLTLSLVT
ncbi:MAG: arsenical efflux pump membrane protein ArsB [Actinomycetota bacterium]|nr:arsenical efflux pump membrane protein ArsB [Actinomycetota bacterium]